MAKETAIGVLSGTPKGNSDGILAESLSGTPGGIPRGTLKRIPNKTRR